MRKKSESPGGYCISQNWDQLNKPLYRLVLTVGMLLIFIAVCSVFIYLKNKNPNFRSPTGSRAGQDFTGEKQGAGDVIETPTVGN